MSDEITHVWIAEAFNTADERVERAVHINEPHARHDIEVLAECNDDATHTTVTKERVRKASGAIPE